jgi:hypothetical protein
MPEEITTDKNVIASMSRSCEPEARQEATRQSDDTPANQSVATAAQQSVETPPLPLVPPLSARDKISLAMGTATENETVTAEVANTIEAAPLPAPATPATPELSERIASLEASLAQRDTSLAEAAQTIETLKQDFTTAETTHLSQAAIASQEIETLKKDFAAADTAHKEAVVEYRRLAVSSNPIFNPDLLAGNSIPEINAAMSRATDLVAKLQAQIEATYKAISVPAGAPERSGPDASGLSARDKISLAIHNDTSSRVTK